MTEENKRILNELIREHSNRYSKPSGLSDKEYELIDTYNDHEDKICEFLKSIPQIESRLCLGGFIQDRNGMPCCDGDEVNFQFVEGFYSGTLKFDHTFKCFTIENEYGAYPLIKDGMKWFEKR